MALTEAEARSLRDYVLEAYGTETFEVYGACTLLWSGREGDTKAVVVRLPDGRRTWGLVAGTVPPGEIATMLRQRITAYRQAIHETEALLTIAGER